MTENTTFIESIVGDYDDLGYGVREGDNALRSKDGETLVSLEPVFAMNDNNKLVQKGITIFSNNDEVSSLMFSDKDFVEKMNEIVASELNF